MEKLVLLLIMGTAWTQMSQANEKHIFHRMGKSTCKKTYLDKDCFSRCKELFLTNLIENGEIEKARRDAMVHIPELEESSYAGYLTVNKTYNSNMFFWFFPAQMDPENAPVILWLQGGPEVASTYALFNEHGPYVFDAEQKLAKNPYSWNIKHNVVYIDNPVGTGYSFTDSDDGYARNEVDVGRNLLIALQQFFCLFPELQKNSFFATGSSYGGKYVPAIGHAILQDSYRTDADSKKPKINLKGLVIGGGSTDPIHQYIYSDLLYETGLVDWHGYESQRKYEEKVINCLKQNNFSCAYDVDNDRIDEFLTISGFNSVNNILKTQSRNYTPFYELIQKPSTRCAIHVGNNTFYDIILDYNDSNEIKAYNYLILDYMTSVADWVCELLPHYPFLLYTGQFDLNVPYHGVENYIKHLNCAGVEAYDKAERIIWRVDGDIAGYVKQVANLTDCMVRNAGHVATAEQPKWILDMLLRFTYCQGPQCWQN